MGSLAEPEPEPISTPKLPPLLTIMSPKESPEDLSGTTPPLYTSASIPFQWEEEPGKPRPCTTLITTVSDHPNTEGPKSLELPPRLQLTESKMTKLPSPTVLDGPYMGFLPKFQEASSFLYKRPEHHRKGSSVSNYSVGSPERGQLGDMVLVSRRGVMRKESTGGGLLGSFGRRKSSRKEELVGGKGRMVRSSSMESMEGFGGGDIEGGGRSSRWKGMPKIRRIGSFSGLSEAARSKYFWATVYEGFKQALPWKSNK